ncbi:MAG: TonB-dependent receptor plug domain-containing protein [Sulfuricurvum sp.]|nr:TonB-dependent receptor plug domain-containing protein [Sulfuricurvum sp.]
MNYRIRYLSLIVSTCLYSADESIIASLNEDLINVSNEATQINQNIDYKPFILTVFNSQDLSKLGVKTLGEALALVPGTDITSDTVNNRTAIIRGSNPLAYGQTKLLIDGVLLNNQTFDSYNSYLDFPIELIKRIEVVRGSGSFIEGVNGYAGTINVISYAQDTSSDSTGTLFGSVGNNRSRSIGFYTHNQIKNWKFSSDLFYNNDDLHTPVMVQGTPKYGVSPIGYANLSNEQLGIGVHLSNNNVIIQGRINEFKTGSAFGNLDVLPNEEGKQNLNSWFLQGIYKQKVSTDLELKFKTKISEDGWKSSSRAIQPIPGVWEEGYWGFLKLKNRVLDGSLMAEYTGFKNHNLKSGYSIKYESAIDMSSITTVKTGGTALVDYTETLPFFNAASAKRHIDEFYITDNFNIDREWALALNAGCVKSEHITSIHYFRTSLLFQPSNKHIIKVMAGNSYRLPSWQEMYVANNPARIGNENLSPELVKSIEVQYINKLSSSLTAGFNLFYLKNYDQIVRNASNQFINAGRNVVQGGEAELRGNFTSADTVFLSYSYINGKVKDSSGYESSLPYTASHLIKASYSYDISDTLTLGGIWNYVGSKKRHLNDTRDELASYNTLDLSVGINMNETKGWYVQGSIKNIGNTIVRYPSTPLTYTDDYPVYDRSYWIRSGWKF